MESSSYYFYKKYHKNKINKLIHLFCIPMIVWSFCCILNLITSYNELKFKGKNILITNMDLGLVICIYYLSFYTFMDSKTFLPMLIYLGLIYLSSYYFNLYVANSLIYAVYINIFSWIMQFIGHIFFEKNRPALIDSISQSFLMAPLFSYYEFKELCLKKND
jgi:2-hydroxy fatty acid dioxygenase